jgi:Zn ribbon nucleic-acid-binding protein
LPLQVEEVTAAAAAAAAVAAAAAAAAAWQEDSMHIFQCVSVGGATLE